MPMVRADVDDVSWRILSYFGNGFTSPGPKGWDLQDTELTERIQKSINESNPPIDGGLINITRRTSYHHTVRRVDLTVQKANFEQDVRKILFLFASSDMELQIVHMIAMWVLDHDGMVKGTKFTNRDLLTSWLTGTHCIYPDKDL